MKTSIDSVHGVVTSQDGNGLQIEGRDHHEAPFDDRWDDLYAFIDQGTGPAQLTYEAYRDTGFFMRFFRHNQDDNIFMTYQMPHQWNHEAVRPHAHVIPMASGSGVVKMTYAYSWSTIGNMLPAAIGWISGSITASFTPADQYVQRVISFGTVEPQTSAADSDILVIKVERESSSASDTYTTNKPDGTGAANLGIIFFDLHYQKIKAGSLTEQPEE